MRYFTSFSTLFALLLLTTVSCEQVDELIGGLNSAPTVSYSSTTIDAEFYTPGRSSTPSIDWNGDQGTISLGTTLDGLSVNSTTGQLTWTKLLPVGTHDVDVIVSNSEGQVVVPITIDNPLAGTFEGTYAGTSAFKLEVFGDGNITLYADGEVATGTWTIEEGKFTAYYVYNNYPDIDYSLVADVNQTNTEATIVGDYYEGQYSPGDDPINVFEVSLQ
ncbi:hypothetical protein [Neolewinella sp.]|uniref:hypothetical protein n=1 Tax=Neolewinella sp. TaxID=2993543 RepID=UPI003B51664A